MPTKYRIFTEGEWDKNFISYFVKKLFGEKFNSLDIQFYTTGGWTNIHNSEPLFREVTDVNGKNLVIFDADFEGTDGGFDRRKAQILAEKAKLNLEFELFLFPNNGSDGEFEDLLERICHDDHKCILECFDNFSACVSHHSSQKGDIYNTPIQKSKIFAYIETVAEKNEFIKSKKLNDMCYGNSNYWNLDSDECIPLKDFLEANIIDL